VLSIRLAVSDTSIYVYSCKIKFIREAFGLGRCTAVRMLWAGFILVPGAVIEQAMTTVTILALMLPALTNKHIQLSKFTTMQKFVFLC
jgi:hypothetical protein